MVVAIGPVAQWETRAIFRLIVQQSNYIINTTGEYYIESVQFYCCIERKIFFIHQSQNRSTEMFQIEKGKKKNW